MKTNEFAIIKKFVTGLLEQYRIVRDECGFSNDAWHSRSIERLSRPFVSGCFTLAVVGKVSSGKSTFINALLGCNGLLPTGHDQTTCGITYIEYGDEPEVTIKFGDGHVVTMKEDLNGKIKPLVAIPERYHDLPVNSLDEMILGGFGFEKIWESREQLEEETLCNRIRKELLKEYVDNRQKRDIPVEVRLKYPFNEELKGWCVIDTPGIGAIGGIETRTKQLLASQKEDRSRLVDAIVFLQDGSRTLDQADTKAFVKKQLDDSFSESDKEHLFYVLTHSGSYEFLNHKDEKMEFIRKNYGDRINSLTYADSLLHAFLIYLEGTELDLKAFEDFERPECWDEDDWDAIMQMFFSAKRHLKKTGNSINNETIWRTLTDWAHFDALKASINQFAKEEKQQALNKLVDYIKNDYWGFISKLEYEKTIVQGDLKEIDEQIDLLGKKRKEYNASIREIARKTQIDAIQKRFAFVETKIAEIDKAPSEDQVRKLITDLFDEVQYKEEVLFEEIKNSYSNLLSEFDNDIILESLDLDAIEKEAENRNTHEYVVRSEQTISHFSRPDDVIPAKYEKRVDKIGKLKDFKANVIHKARKKYDIFMIQVVEKITFMGELVRVELNDKLNSQKDELESLKPKLAEKETFKVKIEALITKIKEELDKMENSVKEYGLTCQ